MASRINVSELDFDAIKSNLKSFLKSQTEFADYDFEGSGLNVLLDVLAYNTHYNSYYLNMIANESFLSTAKLRSSVISHAKQFNYTPRSISAPTSFVKVTVADPSTTGTLTIPAGYTFISELIDNRSYSFTTLSAYTAPKINGAFTFDSVQIYQGNLVTYSYVYNSSINTLRKFILNDTNIDTRTLTVTVRDSETSTTSSVWKLATDIPNITADTPVFYLQEGTDGRFEIYFGDGVLGKALLDGSIVTCNYLVTNGTTANGAGNFIATSDIGGLFAITVDTITAAAGGSDPESTESIKFNAPLQLIAQNRAVSKNDYIKLIGQKYPHFDAINVWGGEDNDPPIYGKIFISAKPKSGFEITDTEKNFVINNIIKPISVMTVIPEFVNADYNYLKVNSELLIDKSETLLQVSDIKELVKQYILDWTGGNLNKFNTFFNYSGLEKGISLLDRSIVSNEIEIMIGKKFRPNLVTANKYILDYGTELVRGTSLDSFFTTPDFTMIDEYGISRQCYFEEIPSSFTGVESVIVNNPGFGYTTTPTITIIGDGSGAQAIATVVNGRVESITVTNPGIGYTSAVIRIEGGGLGRSAAAIPVLEGRYGHLRIVYYKPDAVTNQNTKFVLNAGQNDGKVGIIDYTLGKVTINDYLPKAINNDFGDILIYFKPKSNLIQLTENKMLVLDVNDPTSVTVETELLNG